MGQIKSDCVSVVWMWVLVVVNAFGLTATKAMMSMILGFGFSMAMKAMILGYWVISDPRVVPGLLGYLKDSRVWVLGYGLCHMTSH